nr:hypothetical protein [Mycoplasmopsis bovis]
MVYLVKQVHLKRIYAPKIAIQYLKLKFDEHKITHKVEFIEIEKSAVQWSLVMAKLKLTFEQHNTQFQMLLVLE